MSAARPLLIVVNEDWSFPSALVVTMRNLLKWLSVDEFVVASAYLPRRDARLGGDPDTGMRVSRVLNPPVTGISWRLDEVIRRVYFRTAWPARALERVARRYDCGAVVAVYPDVYALTAGQQAAARLGVPFAAYLHDTIVEGTQGSRIHAYAKKVQASVFRPEVLLFAMSEGLADLLLEKYSLNAIPLPHCYNEPPAEPAAPRVNAQAKTALFAGGIYEINRPAVARAARAATRAGFRIVCTSQNAADMLVQDGLPGDSVQVRSLPSRADYLALLAAQSALFVALSWPDESPIHRDELATIFSTKAPEYLGSGRPILVHCPEDYFLAAFFRKHDCGLVVSDRDDDALVSAWMQLRDAPDTAARVSRNARAVLPYFDGARIAATFREHMALIQRSAPRDART